MGKYMLIQKWFEIIAIIIYLVWMGLTLLLWGSPRMEDNKAVTIFALVIGLVVNLLLNIIRKMPQFRMTKPNLTQQQAKKVVRLRSLWISFLKLLFMLSFASITISLLFNQLVRTIFFCALVGMFFLSLFWYLWVCHKITAKQKTICDSRRG